MFEDRAPSGGVHFASKTNTQMSSAIGLKRLYYKAFAEAKPACQSLPSQKNYADPNLPHSSPSTGPTRHAWAPQAGTSKVETGAIDHTPEAIDVWAAELPMRFGGQAVAVAVEQSRGSLVFMLTKYEHLQFQTLPHFQSEPAGSELPRSFQTHCVQQHPRYLRIIRRRLHMRGEQLQLLGFALFLEDFNGGQPARMRGAIQLARITQCFLARTIRRAHRFDQRPIGVILAVLLATVRPQKHSELIVSWDRLAFKLVGLRYTAVCEQAP